MRGGSCILSFYAGFYGPFSATLSHIFSSHLGDLRGEELPNEALREVVLFVLVFLHARLRLVDHMRVHLYGIARKKEQRERRMETREKERKKERKKEREREREHIYD